MIPPDFALSFVDNKQNKQWVWLALDADTREIVGVYIGARDEAAVRCLWKSLPAVYRQFAIAYTDFWAAYACVLPKAAASSSRQRNRKDKLNPCDSITPCANECMFVSAQNVIVLEVVRQSHWSDLVLCSSLQ